MPSGSCFCGKIKISYNGEAIAQGLCHCWDCRKISGSAFSTNVVVKAEEFSYSGTPKQFHKKSDSGRDLYNYFCGDCGCPLWGVGGFGDAKVVRVGILDGEGLEQSKPMIECYSERRLTWIKAVDDAVGVVGMGDSQKVVEEAGKESKDKKLF